MFRWIIIIASCLLSLSVWAGTLIEGIRVASVGEATKVVLELSQHPDYRTFVLHNPERLVIDIKNGALTKGYRLPDISNTLIYNIRTSQMAHNQLRVVLDLENSIFYEQRLESKGRKNELILEISKKAQTSVQASNDEILVSSNKAIKKNKIPKQGDFVVVIDPGHGGADPGAVGRSGTREKDVVLSIAKKLEQLVNQTPGMRAVMTRDNDYFIGLRQRVTYAREHKGDLFISIHADSYQNTAAYGASVYMLSQRGASSTAARWIAERENRSDLIGGVSLNDKDATLASVLLDLSQAASSAASLELGQSILKELDKTVETHKKHVESAGFAVLKAPDIPSILVESGFLSNPLGEKKLRTAEYQWDVAHSIMKGVRRYHERRIPAVDLASVRAVD